MFESFMKTHGSVVRSERHTVHASFFASMLAAQQPLHGLPCGHTHGNVVRSARHIVPASICASMLETITMVLLFFEWCDRGLLSSEVSALLQRHTLPRPFSSTIQPCHAATHLASRSQAHRLATRPHEPHHPVVPSDPRANDGRLRAKHGRYPRVHSCG